jgi:hypothetical protein
VKALVLYTEDHWFKSNLVYQKDRIWYTITMPYSTKEKMYAAQKRHRQETRKKLTEYLKENPCVECGESDPIVLEFDHIYRDSKTTTVSRIIAGHASWERVLTEIKKCRVLCANCHRRHTYVQMNHWGKTQ